MSSELPPDDQPTISTAAGDQCTSCGAPLAPDQRYCVHCGQRRGQSGMPHAEATLGPVATVPLARRRGPRMSVNSTLIAGIGTLLLAMGVGVLIGRSGAKADATRASVPQIITVAGGGASTASTNTSGKASKSKSKGSKSDAAAKSSSTKAPATIKGTDVKLPAKKVVTIGAKGHGPGYQNGKFTGNFFGGG
jgi:hypothetical protein